MELGAFAQWSAFGIFAFIAVAGALGMATTMSMFRSGIFLMGSFIGVAGLFILLLADLISLLQVMMYIGGMLVMILFMVLFSMDPGGSMMTQHMKLKGLEWVFSLGLLRKGNPEGMEHGGGHGDGHGGGDEGEGMEHGGGGHGEHGGGNGHGGGDGDAGEGMEHGDGGGMDMSMFTPAKKVAMFLAPLTFLLLGALFLLRPAWPGTGDTPSPDSAREIGHLLMDKYMVAFEGAAALILLGIFGAVLVARSATEPGAPDRGHLEAAVDEEPVPMAPEPLEPLYADLRAAEVMEDEDAREALGEPSRSGSGEEAQR